MTAVVFLVIHTANSRTRLRGRWWPANINYDVILLWLTNTVTTRLNVALQILYRFFFVCKMFMRLTRLLFTIYQIFVSYIQLHWILTLNKIREKKQRADIGYFMRLRSIWRVIWRLHLNWFQHSFFRRYLLTYHNLRTLNWQ